MINLSRFALRTAPWLAIGAGGYRLLLQHGRLLLRVEELEGRLAAPARQHPVAPVRGLPPGTLVPDFDLPLLSGGRAILRSFRGRRVVLVFFDPACGFCRELLPRLAEVTSAEPSESRPTTLLLAMGDVERVRQLVEEHGLTVPVLLQDESGIATILEVRGTPTAYLLDEEGATVGELAVGAEDVLARVHGNVVDTGSAVDGPIDAPRLRTRPLSESKLVRDGLPAGTPAPAFRLPRLDGGEVSLDDYAGHRLLLVFSDPDCGPCSAVLPELDDLPDRIPNLAVLVISRRDREANVAKVAELGLTVPVVLQRSWEVSRDYGVFATPVAYVVDDRGVLASGPAVGAQAIRDLAAALAPPRGAMSPTV